MNEKLIENTQSYLRRAYKCGECNDVGALAGIGVEIINYIQNIIPTIEKVEIKKGESDCVCGGYCRNCSYDPHKYCPGCGKEIVWID